MTDYQPDLNTSARDLGLLVLRIGVGAPALQAGLVKFLDLRTVIEKQTEEWGVLVQVVEIKDVEIPESMQRAMAREAEAERERRVKVINARGELQASEELRQASETLSKSPASLQLRYLQTLLELGADQNSTVVFPLPVDILTPFLNAARDNR